ncbi:MAG TPA: hypothetical protein VF575_00030 [Candidatus Saccharimonadales bacterium]|jgi:hypothetical protein
MTELVERLALAHPQLQFVAGPSFYWCPETSEVFYDARRMHEQSGSWSLLHETSHALLGHTSYKADIELLHLEVAAWNHALVASADYGVTIDDDYVQDCLDTYRDWLYRRSLCPGCGTQCLQADESNHYRCFNCHTRWQVSPSRFCRAYRRAQHKKAPPVFALQIRR